ncbi:MAG: DUF5916 domain-containing protein [Bacteroidota bacterium]
MALNAHFLRFIFTVSLLLFGLLAAGQNSEDFVIKIQRVIDPIKVDGQLLEDTWAQADVAADFFRVLPMDTGRAETKTEVRMAYDDRNIYMAITCWDELPGENIAASLKRDFSFSLNDNFLVFIDPFQDKTNGFSFGASAAGAQWDGLQANGGQVLLDWDNKWSSKLHKEEGVHYHEFAIPFKTIRYKKGIGRWGINFSRLDVKRNEKSAWAPVPRQFPTASLAFAGTLEWDEPPPPAGTNISLIPYITGRMIKENAESGTDFEVDAGIDAKIGLTSALNLDLTFNPDFSNVEVDEQVTNLSRFELFFPEKRQFFLENNDLFATLGDRDNRPFFSRRIGLQSPILAGARLSGKLNRDWRIGVMDMMTERVDSSSFASQNYTVAVLQRQVFDRSNVSFFYVGRDAMNVQPEDTTLTGWNRNFGADFNLLTNKDLWAGKVYLHGSMTPEKQDVSHAMEIGYRGQNLEVEWEHRYVGEDYVADVGFVPRTGFFTINPDIGYAWYPKSKVVNRHGPIMRNDWTWSSGLGLTDYRFRLNYELLLLNTSSYSIGYEYNYIQLTRPFDPTNSGNELLPTGSEHNFGSINASIASDRRKLLTYTLEGSYGGFFNGIRTNMSTNVNYRFQPFGSVGMTVDYNRLTFDEDVNNTTFFLVGPQFDITFTNTIFWTTWVQYNEQIDNVNINSRFQWRYAPASDLFIVYSENYLSNDFSSKNRALVIKLNYWLNL